MLEVNLTPAGKAFDGDHMMFTSDITRTFNAKEYFEDNRQTMISATEDLFVFDGKLNYFLLKQITQNEITYFSSSIIDTS